MPTHTSFLGRAGAGLVGLTLLLTACSDAPPGSEATGDVPDPLAFTDDSGIATEYTRKQAVTDLVAGGLLQPPAAECIVDAVTQALGLEILDSPDALTPEVEAILVAITNACLTG